MRRIMSLVVLGAVLVGCGGPAGRSAWKETLPLPAEPYTTPMAEVGVHGGRFVAGSTSSPKTFNPIMANETSSNEVVQRLFTALTDLDYATEGDVPRIARAWTFSDDGRTVTFQLRRGAAFSDGHPITSDDVKFSFDVVMDSTLHPSMQEGLKMDVGGRTIAYTYSAPDSYTFVVTAPGPDALLLSHVSNVRIVPRHILEPAFRAGTFASAYSTATPPESLVTSGAWRLKSYAENDRTVLERNPWWFGVDAKNRRLPYLDQLVFLVAKDQNTAAQKFAAGELDGLDNVKTEDYRTFEADAEAHDFTLHDVGPSLNTNFIWFNLNRDRAKGGRPKAEAWKYALFSQRDFRLAVSHAIDRDALIRGPFFGHALKNWGLLTAASKVWYDSTLTGADLDVTRANQLLDGLKLVDRNGDGIREDAQGHALSFTIIFNGDNKLRASMAALIQDDLAKVGIKVIPTGLDFNTLTARTRTDQDYDLVLLGLGSAVPADPGMGGNFWKSTGATHFWSMKQPEGHPDTPAEGAINEAFNRNVTATDLAGRRAAYRDMSRILNDEAFVVWLPTQLMRIPVRRNFGNLAPSPMPHRILWNAEVLYQKRPAKGR